MTPAIEAALKAHYRDFLKYLLRRVGDPAAAEDILQNFCLRVMQSGTELRDDRSAIGWLYKVLRSVLIDHYRKDAVRQRGHASYTQEKQVLKDNHAAADSDEAICKCIRGLVSDLRPEYAELVMRIDFLEEPRDQVGAELDITQQNLRVRLHRARLAIGSALQKHCGTCCKAGYDDCSCDRDCTRTGSPADQQLRSV
uniref:RNA polymerase sigma factor n=1 Tax=Pararhizobium sp. IMCC3301 TaxID=3067904 RepID=UPI0027419A5C|nr:sigma-70 family RNA polymerase sigma factor [Pararhizobium sp. IMCC3301]